MTRKYFVDENGEVFVVLFDNRGFVVENIDYDEEYFEEDGE